MIKFARVNDLKMQKFDKLIKNEFDSKCLTVKNRLSASLTNLRNSFFQKKIRTGGEHARDDKIAKNQVRFVTHTGCVIVKMFYF